MLHTSTRKLIDRLAEMTELGKLDWAEGEGQNIVYSTEGYSVSLIDAPNELVITSKDGRELERATSDELTATVTEDGKTYATIVAEMTSEAIRIARGTEVAISTLLAGMDEPVTEAAPVAEPILTAEAPEDAVDETTALSTLAVASVAAVAVDKATEPDDTEADAVEEAVEEVVEVSEAVDEIADDTAGLVATDATIEDAVEQAETPETESDTERTPVILGADSTDTEPDTEITASDDTIESVAETETDVTETESGVTEAVARMAEEVNQREETPETPSDYTAFAASGAALGAAALFAGQGSDSEAETESEPVVDMPEPVSDPIAEFEAPTVADLQSEPLEAVEEETVSEPEPVIAAAPEPITKSYVPFGLEALETPATVDEAVAEASDETDLAAAPIEAPEPEPELESSLEDAATPHEGVAPETNISAETPAFEPMTDAETISDPEPEPDLTQEPVAEPEPVAETEALTPAASAPEPAPQSYSLSGIGAGFGLGAMSAKTEASGVPGPSAGIAPASDKVVIDATDDVLPKPESHLNVPLAEKVTAAVKASAPETPKAEEATEEGADILKPRTRFNPWD